MKKLISFGVVSAMVASMSTAAFAMTEVAGKTAADLNVYQLQENSTVFSKATKLTVSDVTQNNCSFSNAIQIKGTNPDFVTLAFGISSTCPFAKFQTKPAGMEVLKIASSSPVKRVKEGTFNNSGVTCEVGTKKLTVDKYGEVSMPVVTIDFTNTSTKDRDAAFIITLKDAAGNTKDIKLVTLAGAFDGEDVSAAEVDKNDDGVREFNDGTVIGNGYPVSAATLKTMNSKGGKYQFNLNTGVSIVASISKSTVNAGRTDISAETKADNALTERYDGVVGLVDIPALSQEDRAVNVDIDNNNVIKAFGSDFCDKLLSGDVKRVYGYAVNDNGYNALAEASGNDGLVNTDEVIAVAFKDNKLVFNVPAGVTKVMLTTKEVDTTKLPAIPGVVVSDATVAANEVTAPVITDETAATSTAPVVAPSVVSAPIMDNVPATASTVANTGANDVVVLAIALAAISMTAAGAVAYRKF